MMRGGTAPPTAELRWLSMQRGGAAPPAAELRWLSMQRVAHVVHGTVTLVFSSTHLGALASLWQGAYEFACVQMLVRRLPGRTSLRLGVAPQRRRRRAAIHSCGEVGDGGHQGCSRSAGGRAEVVVDDEGCHRPGVEAEVVVDDDEGCRRSAGGRGEVAVDDGGVTVLLAAEAKQPLMMVWSPLRWRASRSSRQ